MAGRCTRGAEQFFALGRADKKPEARTGVRVGDPAIAIMGPVLACAAFATYGQFGPNAGRGMPGWARVINRSPGCSASPGMGSTSAAQVRVIQALAVATGGVAAVIGARHG